MQCVSQREKKFTMWSLSIVIEKPLLPQIRHFLRLILYDMNIVTFIPAHPHFFFLSITFTWPELIDPGTESSDSTADLLLLETRQG